MNEHKYALILSGHLRTYNLCYASQKKNLIAPLNPDVFLHTWTTIEAETASWHKSHLSNRCLNEKEKSEIQRLYQTKSSQFEVQYVNPHDNATVLGSSISLQGMRFMVESYKKACALKSEYENVNGFKYDVIVKCRPDVEILKPLVIPSEMEYKTLFMFARKIPNGVSVCDVLNCMSSKTIDFICSKMNVFLDDTLQRPCNINHWYKFLNDIGITIEISHQYYGTDWVIRRQNSVA